MNTPRKLAKAKLIEIEWKTPGTTGEPKSPLREVTVQFNPASLRVSYANQVQTNDQSNNASTQYVGRGTSKLTLELLFDVSMPPGEDAGSPGSPSSVTNDVREMTNSIAYFIKPRHGTGKDEDKLIPPGARLLWGSFLFDGIVESMDETLELWSEDGIPLRAVVSLGMIQQGGLVDLNLDATPSPVSSAAGAPGTRPMVPSRQGDSVQSMAGRSGLTADWQAIARANGIENPRNLAPGTLLDLRPGAGARR
jgi:hypothetical protein